MYVVYLLEHYYVILYLGGHCSGIEGASLFLAFICVCM